MRAHVPACLLTLDLTRLRLRVLPEAVAGLPLLQRLDVSHNALCALPESLGELPQLRELLAAANRLTTLPLSLATLPQPQRAQKSALASAATAPHPWSRLAALRAETVPARRSRHVGRVVQPCTPPPMPRWRLVPTKQ